MAGSQSEIDLTAFGEPDELDLRQLPHLDAFEAVFDLFFADHMARIQAEIHGYSTVSFEQLTTELRPSSAYNWRIFVSSLRDQRSPTEDELLPVAEIGASRADDGFDFSALAESYSIGFEVATLHYFALAEPEYHALFVRRSQQFYRHVLRALSSGYIEGLRYDVRTRELERRQLLEQILSPDLRSQDRAVLVDRFSATADVLRLHLAPIDGEGDGSQFGRVLGRRKIRRVVGALLAESSSMLSNLRTNGGLVVLPARDAFDPDAFLEIITEYAGVYVAAAYERCDVGDVAAANQRLRDVLFLGTALRPRQILYRMDDVVLEYQLTRPGAALDLLLAAVEPLRSQPELAETVLRFLIHGRNRRRTALDLHIHPNTVDYRVAKAAKLTGLDPGIPAEANRLHASLIALRLADDRARTSL